MKKFLNWVARFANLVVWICLGYFMVSPIGHWAPTNPNWVDFWLLVVFGVVAAKIDIWLSGSKPDDKDPKPPKGAKYA